MPFKILLIGTGTGFLFFIRWEGTEALEQASFPFKNSYIFELIIGILGNIPIIIPVRNDLAPEEGLFIYISKRSSGTLGKSSIFLHTPLAQAL